MAFKETSLRIKISDSIGEVSALLSMPSKASCLLVLAHGAGAGMKHPFMLGVAASLFEQGIAVLRFNFRYMEKGKKGVDPPAIAVKTISRVFEEAQKIAKGIPVFAGGKSFGGRMSSTAASQGLLKDLKGLVFFGFPLHAIGKPSSDRAAHLFEVKVPMLFLQGTKDKLADIGLMQEVGNKLGKKAKLHQVEGADHSFKISKDPKVNAAALEEICGVAADWMKALS